MIFGPTRKRLVWAPGEGVTANTSSWRAPSAPWAPPAVAGPAGPSLRHWLKGMRGHKVIFTCPPSPLIPFNSYGYGERCKLPQRGLGRSPSRQLILEHSIAKSDRFDLLLEIFQRSKQQETFWFLLRISYFQHSWHNGSYSTGLPCQNGKYYSFCTYILKIL